VDDYTSVKFGSKEERCQNLIKKKEGRAAVPGEYEKENICKKAFALFAY
jgi:hypothetical protein